MPRDLLNDIKSSAPAVDLEKGEKQPSRDEKKDKPEMKQSEGGQRFFSDVSKPAWNYFFVAIRDSASEADSFPPSSSQFVLA